MNRITIVVTDIVDMVYDTESDCYVIVDKSALDVSQEDERGDSEHDPEETS